MIKLNKFNEFKLFGVTVCCFGHDDIGNKKAITGMTAYGAYINEATLAHNEVIKQILKRCSADRHFKARVIMDTNPDSPKHPIKVDYIDKQEELDKRGNRIVKAFHWRLDDNTFLSEDFKAGIRAATPSGVFTNRDIEGLWVTPEGVVYLDFDEDKHVIDVLPDRFVRYFAGVDWGYEHHGSICLFGIEPDDTIVLIKEVTTRHKLIDWWINEAQKIKAEYGYGIPFYCDDARPDNIAEFRRSDIWVLEANKSVLQGIESVAKKFKTCGLKIYKGGTSMFLDEIYTYAWGKDGKPIKVNDNVMDAIRYAIFTDKTIRGN